VRRNLKSVSEFAAGGPFTEGQLRWWIFNAATNGLDEVGAIVRVQRRVYVDVDKFDEWTERQNSQSDETRQMQAAAQRSAQQQ
jgi:hypothetical protein